MPDVVLRAAFAALALAAPSAGCHDRVVSAPCPQGNWCTTIDRASEMKQTPERQLQCAVYIAWGREGGGAPDPALPAVGEGNLDRESTRKQRGAASGSEVCCYHFYASCSGAFGR
jgi:hypothetical protein